MPHEDPYLGPERPNSLATKTGESVAALGEFDDAGQTKTSLVTYLDPIKYRGLVEAMRWLCPEYPYPDRFRNGAAFTLRLSQETGKLWHALLDNLDMERNGQFWRAGFPIVLKDEDDMMIFRSRIETGKGIGVFVSNQRFDGKVVQAAHVALRVWVRDVRFITPGGSR